MMRRDPTKFNCDFQSNNFPNPYPPVNQPRFGMDNMYQSYQPLPSNYGLYSSPAIVNARYPPPLIAGTGYPPPPPIAGTGYPPPPPIAGTGYPPPPPMASPGYLPLPIASGGYTQSSMAGSGYTPSNVQYYSQPQQNRAIMPNYRPFMANQILTTITPKLRAIFIISSIFYLIWSLSIVGLEITITIKTYWTFYRSVWTTGFMLGAGISLLIVSCRISYPIMNLIRIFMLSLIFCLLGVTLSSINYVTATKCSNLLFKNNHCDDEIVNLLKLINIGVYTLATVHTLINLFIFSHEHNKTSLQTTV